MAIELLYVVKMCGQFCRVVFRGGMEIIDE